jgi:hypothetical protein
MVNNSANINKWITTFHFKPLSTNKKTMIYGIGNPGSGSWQSQKCACIGLCL